jgi:hypothetical protein
MRMERSASQRTAGIVCFFAYAAGRRRHDALHLRGDGTAFRAPAVEAVPLPGQRPRGSAADGLEQVSSLSPAPPHGLTEAAAAAALPPSSPLLPLLLLLPRPPSKPRCCMLCLTRAIACRQLVGILPTAPSMRRSSVPLSMHWHRMAICRRAIHTSTCGLCPSPCLFMPLRTCILVRVAAFPAAASRMLTTRDGGGCSACCNGWQGRLLDGYEARRIWKSAVGAKLPEWQHPGRLRALQRIQVWDVRKPVPVQLGIAGGMARMIT